jgi:hypothetical protein
MERRGGYLSRDSSLATAQTQTPTEREGRREQAETETPVYRGLGVPARPPVRFSDLQSDNKSGTPDAVRGPSSCTKAGAVRAGLGQAAMAHCEALVPQSEVDQS